MQQEFQASVAAPGDRVFAVLADLSHYDELLGIVHQVVADDSEAGDEPAWWVTLRAKLGPLARSKRLRMVRTVNQPDQLVRFERRETDGRQHSAWTLDARIDPNADGSGTVVTMGLDYGGRLWSGVLDGVLQSQVDSAAANLERLAQTSTPT